MNKLTLETVCDGCGLRLAKIEGRGSVDGFKRAFWDSDLVLKKGGIITQQLQRRATRHYCLTCADNPPTKRVRKINKNETLRIKRGGKVIIVNRANYAWGMLEFLKTKGFGGLTKAKINRAIERALSGIPPSPASGIEKMIFNDLDTEQSKADR